MAKGGAHLAPKKQKNTSGRHSTPRNENTPAEPAYPRHRAETSRTAPTRSKEAAAPAASRRGDSAAPAAARRKRRKSDRFPLWPLVIVLAAVMLFAGWKLLDILLSYRRDRSTYDDLRNIAVLQLTPAPQPAAGQNPPETADLPAEPVSQIPLQVDWELLRQTNPDIIGWLYCPDTVINYPVVQTVDNDKYLTRDFNGNISSAGTIFADFNSVVGIRQSHLILYGHNVKDDSMFGSLKSYGDYEYYEDHPVFYFLTPGESYRIELMACQTIEAVKANYPTYFSTEEDFGSHIARMTGAAYWVNADYATTQYQFITLSTCTASDAERLVLQGVMIPIE